MRISCALVYVWSLRVKINAMWLALGCSRAAASSFLRTNALLTTSRMAYCASKEDGAKSVVFEQSVTVPSFGGSLWVRSSIPVRVSPIDAMECPNLDRALVRVVSTTASASKNDVSVDVRQEGHKLSVTADAVGNNAEGLRLKHFLPMIHDVNVSVSGSASVEASDLIESNYCSLTSEAGNIEAAKIKTGHLTLESKTGDVLCLGHLQARTVIKTQSGSVIADKRFTGESLEVSTESGDIRVASCYTEHSYFSTQSGSLNLRNIHNDSSINVHDHGNVSMLGLDGSTQIYVKKGDVECHASQIRSESRIHVENGDIILRVSDTFPLKLSIEANDIIPDTKFATYGKVEPKEDGRGSKVYFCAIRPEKFSPFFHIIAENGNVVLESTDWAASLGLKLPQ